MKTMLVALLALLAVALASLSVSSKAHGSPPSPPSGLSLGYAKFGFNLFRYLLERGKDTNIFVSPASVAFNLALLNNGAAGETQTAITKVLGVEGLSQNDINQANLSLKNALLTPDPQVTLSIANSLWLRKGIIFKPDFLKRNQEVFGAVAKVLDFADPRAKEVINAWVKEKTAGKILEIIETIQPLTYLYVINAIYFKGKWTYPFDKALTNERPFTRVDGTKKPWPMMSQSGRFRYYHGENFQAVMLPYGVNKKMEMAIFLPDPTSDLKRFCLELNESNWQQWLANFRPTRGKVVLPRFTLEYHKVLNGALEALGMGVAFDTSKADFSNLCSIPPVVSISEVRHKTFVEVNEEGTEAAAVSTTGLVGAAAPVGPEFSMIMDRPFFLAIYDGETDSLLFLGAIMDPK